MRRIALTVLALSIAVVAHADWTHYRTAQGGFAADLPDRPVQKTSTIPIQGSSVTTHTFTAQGHGAVALITATMLPSALSASSATGFHKSYIDSFIRSSHAHETSRHHLTIHGFSGEEALFTLNGQVGSVWVFVKGRRGFGLTVMVTKSGLDPVKNRIYNSFKMN